MIIEQKRVKQTLKDINFSLASIAELPERGSFLRENIKNATRGIWAELQWCIEQLEKQEKAK